jgi:hypothetical protein
MAVDDLPTTSAMSAPALFGCGPIGLNTIAGRATNAAWQPALRAPVTSQEWAATNRTSRTSTSNADATDRYASGPG